MGAERTMSQNLGGLVGMTLLALLTGLVGTAIRGQVAGSPDAGQLAAQDPDNITAALLAFKDSIAGFDAAIKPSQLEWTSTGLPVCTGDKSNWQHVQCSSGSIVGLNFSQVSLGGASLESNWGQLLSQLSSLDLAGTDLHGRIPPEWGEPGAWQSLRHLNLSGNVIAGELPAWTDADAWPELVELDLSFNRINSSLPISWGLTLSSLQYLDLGSNFLYAPIPEDWGLNGSFPSLHTLIFDSNRLLACSLPQLWGSDGSMANLRVISARDCALVSSLPAAWHPNLNLTHIFLSTNTLSGSLPLSWQYMELQELVLRVNILHSTIPDGYGSLGSWASMTTLDLAYNQFIGSLPVVLGPDWSTKNLPSIQPQLQGNGFAGTIEPDLAIPGRFRSALIYPGNIAVCGAIPEGLTVYCDYDDGPSAGLIDGVQLMDELIVSDPTACQCQAAFWSLMNEWVATYSARLVSGWNYAVPMSWPICKWTGILCSAAGLITAVDTSNVFFSGPLDHHEGSIPSMESLNMSNNQFKSLPASLPAFLPGLKVLNMSGNLLQDALNPGLGMNDSWPLLELMDLSASNISGQIPEWGEGQSLASLSMLDLSSNNLAGTLPNWRTDARMPGLQRFYVKPGNPELCGPSKGLPLWDRDAQAPLSGLPSCSSLGPQGQGAADTLSSGAIAGIVVGAVVAAVGAVAIGGLAWRHRAHSKRAKPQGPSFHDGTHLSRHLPRNLEVLLEEGNSASSNSSHAASSTGLSAIVRKLTMQRDQPDAFSSVHFDWRISPSRLELCRRGDGTVWTLGSGGFGTVCKAKLDQVQDVAVKFLHTEGTLYEAESLRRFAEEVALVREAHDAAIVAFRGAWLSTNLVYLVQEFLENGDLYRALSRESVSRSLTWYQRGRTIALDVAHGLRYLHSHHVIHLDMKSPNILLTRDWRAKIADVGLARTLVSRSRALEGAVGTYDWSAPEVLVAKRATSAADIFSYGVILLEIITNQRQERSRYIMPRPEECPPEIADLVERCMEAEPSRRPSAKDIIMCIAGSQTTVPDSPQSPHTEHESSQHIAAMGSL